MVDDERGAAAHVDLDQWFEMSNDLLCTASLDGYFTQLNPAWEQCLGFTRDELMARPYVDFIHPNDVEATFAAAGHLGEGPSQIVNFENRYRAEDGHWRWLLWSARSDGEWIYAVAKDITERKEFELEREQLVTRLEAIARTDELTGLPNRRSWDEELQRELARAARHGTPLCVAMLDLDTFKAYNDAHGHLAGDTLLREAGAAWRLALRVTDFIARYGGEEFALLLPDCPLEAALAVLTRLRSATPPGQTCSIGVAQWDSAERAEALLGRADAALYQAKHAGRDRVVAAS